MTIELNGGAAAVTYDPNKWSKKEQNRQGTIILGHITGAGSAAIMAEREGVPSIAAVDLILQELGKEHSDLKLLSREMRTVHGQKVCCVKYSFLVDNLEMIVYANCYGGLAGTLQVRTCTTADTFDECEPDFTELLNGLEILPIAHPTLRRLGQGRHIAVRVTRRISLVLAFAFVSLMLRTNWRTALPITAGLTVAVFAIAWTYSIVKYKLD